MPQKSSSEIMNQLFAEINNIVLPADISADAPPPAGFASLMLPGETVHASDYDIKTIDGKRNLFVRMDKIPAFNKQYIDSTKTVSGLFSQILSANTPKDNPEAAAKKKNEYDLAQKILASEKYDTYMDCRDDYQDAIDEYLYQMNKVPQDAQALKKAQRSAARAIEKWVARGSKNEIDDALNTSLRYLAYTPKSVYASAQKQFEKERDTSGVDDTLPVVCLPESWATQPDKLSWTHVVITQKSQISKMHHEVEKIDSEFSAKGTYGLWSASASGGYHSETEKLNKSSQVDNLGFAFDIAKIVINRSWFNGNLLTYDGVSIPGVKKGGLCAGSLKDANKCTFPFVPTAFIVARNINIYNEFSSEEESFFNKSTSWSANASVGYGPFSLNNKTSSSKKLTDEEKKQFGNAIKITVGEGMQIIGFVCSVLTPAFPSANSTDMTVHSNAAMYTTAKPAISVASSLMSKLDSYTLHNNQYGDIKLD